MQSSLDLSIIIVNWNSAQFVRQCVESIVRNTTGLTYEIIVIDNASFDGYEQVTRDYPDVICIQSAENLGFAKANNQAFAKARGASLLFLNPDTKIIGAAIATLHQALQQLPDAGAVGAKLLNSDGTLQTSCIQAFPTLLNQALSSELLLKISPKSELWGMELLHRSNPASGEVEGISGACLMIRREIFERIGLFSEDYFMYTEDIDLCYKVRKANWKNYYVPDATVIHFGGSSSKQAASNFSSLMMRESIWKFLRKTRGDFYGRGYRGSMFLSALFRLGLIVVLFPIQILRGRYHSWMASCQKWWVILMWSLVGVKRLRKC